MSPAAREVERVARLAYGQLVARLAAHTGRISEAEDALSDALLRALETWPAQGVPPNPEAWLITTARRRITDRYRTEQLAITYEQELTVLATRTEEHPSTLDPRIGLMFACAHPAIDAKMRAPLMLQTVLGLDARRMASVFLTSPAALGQALSRAKRKIEEAGIGFVRPQVADEYRKRVDDILQAVYAAYVVGHNASGSDDDKAGALAQEALWLVSTICDALPDAAEAHGLFALILFTEARTSARVDPKTGALVPLGEQDVTLWHSEMLADAEAALGNAQRHLSLGRFQLEAAIQAVHAHRRISGHTDWPELAKLYEGLTAITASLGAHVGQAAVALEADGPARALDLLDACAARAHDYQPWFATKAHAHARLGQNEAAIAAFEHAMVLATDPAARAYLAKARNKLMQ
ncbi:MAG: DUF6596 domain-containing protein [Pseudomonadota bacterium]